MPDNPGGATVLIDQSEPLAEWLSKKENEGTTVRTRLRTSDRVIARVTDGIYRQPASALRELISNAWDADANAVTILTDAPRFSRIYVRDDGAGMSYKTLARLLHHIGGSAKRRDDGRDLGITAQDDPDKTPRGRPLIGKIGIGLFSVSQLARRFRIVTKVQGEDYRLVAEVRLRTYAEDAGDDVIREDDDRFVNGEVVIIREAAEDHEAHGTDIIIDDVKPRVRDLLRSADRWRALAERKAAEARGDEEALAELRVEAPRYHAGWIQTLTDENAAPSILTVPPNLPWDTSDPPEVRMGLLMDAVASQFRWTERPDLATTLDTYLETLWVLGLSVPVGYVEKHPFELTADDNIRLFWLPDTPRGQAIELVLPPGETVRNAVQVQVKGNPELQDGLDAPAGGFKVTVDGVELRRPIRFRYSSYGAGGFDTAMLFVGKYKPDLGKVDPKVRGGNLSVEGYLFWNRRIIPKENNGVLIRIRGTSGALFDPTFFKYQVSEQTRLRQITSEMFVRRGLDAALNIDRESFNFSHPHVQLVATWVHRSIRKLTNTQKDLSKRLRTERRAQDAALDRDVITRYSELVWSQRQGVEPPPEVAITRNQDEAQRARERGYIALVGSEIPVLTEPGSEDEQRGREAKAEALIRILAAYNVLADRPYEEQQTLVEAILTLFLGRRAE